MSNNLREILLELDQHKNNDRQKLLAEAISKRLNDSLQVYYHELDKTVTNLSSKSAMRVSKEMAKYEQ